MEQVVADVRGSDCDEDDRAGAKPAHRGFARSQRVDFDGPRCSRGSGPSPGRDDQAGQEHHGIGEMRDHEPSAGHYADSQ